MKKLYFILAMVSLMTMAACSKSLETSEKDSDVEYITVRAIPTGEYTIAHLTKAFEQNDLIAVTINDCADNPTPFVDKKGYYSEGDGSYGYGVFDDPSKVEFKLIRDHNFTIIYYVIKNGKNIIAKNGDMYKRPLAASSSYTVNKMSYNNSSPWLLNMDTDLSDGTSTILPDYDFYAGSVFVTATKTLTTVDINVKRYVYGVTVNATNVPDNGTLYYFYWNEYKKLEIGKTKEFALSGMNKTVGKEDSDVDFREEFSLIWKDNATGEESTLASYIITDLHRLDNIVISIDIEDLLNQPIAPTITYTDNESLNNRQL